MGRKVINFKPLHRKIVTNLSAIFHGYIGVTPIPSAVECLIVQQQMAMHSMVLQMAPHAKYKLTVLLL